MAPWYAGSGAPKSISTKPCPACGSSQPGSPPARTGASSSGAPGSIQPSKVSPSGVFNGDCVSSAGTDKRPLLTSARPIGSSSASDSTASRSSFAARLLGVMKSVARVLLSRFSSAAKLRSAS